MCVLSFVNASWVLVNAQCTIRFLAASLCDAYSLLVGALPDGYLDTSFVRCSEPGTAFGVECPMKEIVETLG
jgi:hypothetical protein